MSTSRVFALGIYGDDTENEFDTFKQKLEGAGLEKVTEELITWYNAYVEKKGSLRINRIGSFFRSKKYV